MAITHDLISKAGEYTNKDGETKVRWHKCGVEMDTKTGGIALNIESLPINFDGWIQMRTPIAKGEGNVTKINTKPDADFETEVPF